MLSADQARKIEPAQTELSGKEVAHNVSGRIPPVPPLSIQEYRDILGDQESSDEEIKRRYDAAYKIADAIFDQWLRKRNKNSATPKDNDTLQQDTNNLK